MSIGDDFKNFDILNTKIKNHNAELSIIQNQLHKIETGADKDPFTFLKKSNNVDVLKKREIQLRDENVELKHELVELPSKIRGKICNSVHKYFEEKTEVEEQKVATELEKIHKQKRNKTILFSTGGTVLLVCLGIVAKKIVL